MKLVGFVILLSAAISGRFAQMSEPVGLIIAGITMFLLARAARETLANGRPQTKKVDMPVSSPRTAAHVVPQVSEL